MEVFGSFPWYDYYIQFLFHLNCHCKIGHSRGCFYQQKLGRKKKCPYMNSEWDALEPFQLHFKSCIRARFVLNLFLMGWGQVHGCVCGSCGSGCCGIDGDGAGQMAPHKLSLWLNGWSTWYFFDSVGIRAWMGGGGNLESPYFIIITYPWPYLLYLNAPIWTHYCKVIINIYLIDSDRRQLFTGVVIV